MIGSKYWSTGVIVTPCADKWSAEVQFFDDGFCNGDSTEGSLRTRYTVGLSDALDLVIKDAQRLGVEFKDPAVYVEGDKVDDQLAQTIKVECDRLGWKNIY